MKLTNTFAALAVSATVVLSAAGVKAETLSYTVTGDYTAAWQMDSNPNVFPFDAGTFGVADVVGTFSGSDDGVVTAFFFNPAFGGGLQIYDDSLEAILLDASGAQLWIGTLAAPTMLTGTFVLGEFGGGPGLYTLTVAVVPEPSALMLMWVGLGVVGAVARVGHSRARQVIGKPSTELAA